MSANPQLGAPAPAPGIRDAMHVSLISGPVRGCNSYPGWKVGLSADGHLDTDLPAIGIIDPFFNGGQFDRVPDGTVVWCLLKPGMVSDLRHVWTAPAIDTPPLPESERSPSEEWLRDYAVRQNPYVTNPEDAFRKMIGEAREGTVFFSGRDCHDSSDVDPAFFEHITVYLGQNLSPEDFEYGCSC